MKPLHDQLIEAGRELVKQGEELKAQGLSAPGDPTVSINIGKIGGILALIQKILAVLVPLLPADTKPAA